MHCDSRTWTLTQGILRSGLNSGKVQFLDKPKSKNSDQNDGSVATTWDVYDLHPFREPVSVISSDITGDDSMDLIVCHQYGPNMKECDMQGGWVSWLKNPGRNKLDKNKEWVKRDIGRWPAMHRLSIGYFTQRYVSTLNHTAVLPQYTDLCEGLFWKLLPLQLSMERRTRSANHSTTQSIYCCSK